MHANRPTPLPRLCTAACGKSLSEPFEGVSDPAAEPKPGPEEDPLLGREPGPEEDPLGRAAAWLSPHARALLVGNDTRKWAIEQGGFLTNHLHYGILSLAALGADDGFIDEFVDYYTQRLEPPSPRRRSNPTDAEGDPLLPLGARQFFAAHVRAFEREVCVGAPAGSCDPGAPLWAGEVVSAGHQPGTTLVRLLDGLAGAAFHSLINCGIGLRFRIGRCSVEGLAYLAHSWLPVGGGPALFDNFEWEDTDESEQDGLAVVTAIRDDGELSRLLTDEWSAVEKLPTGYFQRCMHAFAAHGGAGTAPALGLLTYARRVALPSKPLAAVRALLELALRLFLGADTCDYFLLHGVVACASLAPLVAGLTRTADGLRVCRRMVCALLATYVAQGCPELASLAGEEQARNDDTLVDIDGSWAAVRETALAEGGLRNEHAYKLVWLCEELDREGAAPDESEEARLPHW